LNKKTIILSLISSVFLSSLYADDSNTTIGLSISPTGPGITYTDPSQFPQTKVISKQLSQIHAEVAYNNGYTGGNLSKKQKYTIVGQVDKSNRNLQTIVAVLDSGINANSVDFNTVGKIAAYKDFTSTSTTPSDTVGHGTVVSSIIAGNRTDINDPYYGVAYEANLVEGKVVNSNGSTTNQILNTGINWVIAEKKALDVRNVTSLVSLNLSLGSTSSAFVDSTFSTTLINALKAGITIVVAAGNSGLNCVAVNGSINGQCSFPAAAPWVDSKLTSNYLNNNGGWLVVGSVDANNVISSFSNRAGITASNFLVAPGENIIGASNTNNSGFVQGSGTSFAAPLVSGSLALMAQKWPYLTGRQQAQILLDTATDLGAKGVDPIYGHGLLNLTAAFSPVKTIMIPSSTNLTVANVTGKDISNTGMILSSAMANLSSLESLNSIVGVDYYNRDFKMNMTSSISSSGSSPVDFDNFMAFNYGNFIFGVDASRNLPMIGYKIDGTSKVRFSFDNSLLGMKSTGVFNIGQAYTSYLNYEKQFNITEDIKIKANGTYAYSTASTADNSIIDNISSIHSVGGKVKGMYDNFGIGYEIPLRTISGNMNFNAPTSVDEMGNVSNTNIKASLSPNTFEQTTSLFYEESLRNLYVLTALEHTSDAYGVKGLNNDAAKISLNYFY
jgi:subtilisin family serine protease